MVFSVKNISLKTLIVWVVMGITTLALVVTSSISLINQITNYKNELTQQVLVYAELIGSNASTSIKFDDDIVEHDNLTILSAAKFIEAVHIYKYVEGQNPTFFTSYNRADQLPIPPMWSRIDELKKPVQIDNHYEFIRPIENNNELLGYVYIRVSADILNKLIASSILTTLAALVVILIICYLLTLRLQKALADPITNLVTLVQRISRQRDYKSRAENTNIKELNILGGAFNDMLDRTQHYLQERDNAEMEQQKLHASLEEKVQLRTVALKEANQELIETLEKLHQFQRQMVQNEKMASLGDMVAGVAHEVNTPIGLGVTASTMMLDRLKNIEKEFDAKTLKASTLSKFISEGQENLNIIYRNLNRAAELISSFKQVAVDQTSESNRTFSFSQLMDEILLSMRPKLKKYDHVVTVHCPSDLYIETKAGPINQIMMNLIMNSIIHGFEFIQKGNIDIYVEMITDNKIKIRYVDDGKGIPEHLRKRIFDPFVTTKRGQGGSGLGMHLVYNLITQALNGSITITSEINKGVEFTILFPVRKVNASTMVKSS
ncbi:ATP-binding protein [Aliiglaciecola lipolytica]|uniref:histidine kinase n=1 Tax=Aliiglaciecola lipolytica E3 TaxID=1127673 RepID=K6Y6A6_9ALTE|nr:ATP-binding protein [Aliiglaciecola lipolytica]GAC13762.1 signal transduction histidine kinase [Aliiglaciecola lipolytica E3]